MYSLQLVEPIESVFFWGCFNCAAKLNINIFRLLFDWELLNALKSTLLSLFHLYFHLVLNYNKLQLHTFLISNHFGQCSHLFTRTVKLELVSMFWAISHSFEWFWIVFLESVLEWIRTFQDRSKMSNCFNHCIHKDFFPLNSVIAEKNSFYNCVFVFWCGQCVRCKLTLFKHKNDIHNTCYRFTVYSITKQ